MALNTIRQMENNTIRSGINILIVKEYWYFGSPIAMCFKIFAVSAKQ